MTPGSTYMTYRINLAYTPIRLGPCSLSITETKYRPTSNLLLIGTALGTLAKPGAEDEVPEAVIRLLMLWTPGANPTPSGGGCTGLMLASETITVYSSCAIWQVQTIGSGPFKSRRFFICWCAA